MQSEVSSLGDRVEVISLTRRESCREVHVLQGGGGKVGSNAACPGFPIVTAFLREP